MITPFKPAPFFETPVLKHTHGGPSLPSSSLKLLEFAHHIFQQPSEFKKIYFNNNSEACAKIGLVESLPQYPHSIRKIDRDTFTLTLNRKSKETFLGRGTFKVAKAVLQVQVISPSEVTLEEMALVKDTNSTSIQNFVTDPYGSLKGAQNVEYIQKINHQTSKGTFIQFHVTRKAICDAAHLYSHKPKLNFSQIVNICRDIANGVFELYQLGLIQADMKPRNVLIFSPNSACPRYHARISDLNSIRRIGVTSRSITYAYLSIGHYLSFLATEAKKQKKPRNEVVISDDQLSLYSYLLQKETALQTLGLCLADIGLQARTYLGLGPSEQMLFFWDIVKTLIRFTPTSEMISYIEFRNDLNIKLRHPLVGDYHGEGDFVVVTSKLDTISSPPLTVPILSVSRSSELDLEIIPFIIPRDDLSELQLSILTIYAFFLNSAGHKKIYFEGNDAYVKQMNGTGLGFKNSIRVIDASTFVVEFNRKEQSQNNGKGTNRIAKRVWKVALSTPSLLTAEALTLVKDVNTERKEPTPWAIEELTDLTYVECVKRITHQTSGLFYKRFHIVKSADCNWNVLIQRHSVPLNFQMLIQYCRAIISGVNELHERGFLYGNITRTYTLFYPEEVIAKLTASPTVGRFGNIFSGMTLHFLSPSLALKVFSKVKRIFPNPTFNNFYTEYYNNETIRSCALTPLDEVASLGILISDIICVSSSIISKERPATIRRLCAIATDLTGGIDFTKSKYILKDIYSYVSKRSQDGKSIPLPLISLHEAAARLSALF